jgi:hypothetical protein
MSPRLVEPVPGILKGLAELEPLFPPLEQQLRQLTSLQKWGQVH